MRDSDVIGAPIAGSRFPLKVNIDPVAGLHMSDFDFEIVFSAVNEFKVEKREMMKIDNDNYAVVVDTGITGPGRLKARVKVTLPDAFSMDKKRVEIVDVDTKVVVGR